MQEAIMYVLGALILFVIGALVLFIPLVVFTISVMTGVELYIWIMSDTTLALFFKE